MHQRPDPLVVERRDRRTLQTSDEVTHDNDVKPVGPRRDVAYRQRLQKQRVSLQAGCLQLSTQLDAVTVPRRAVMEGSSGYFCYVVRPDGRAERRSIELGPVQDGIAVLERGVKAGDKGVIEKCFDALAEWRHVARDVSGRSLPCGHYIPEEAPEELVAEML